MSKRARRATIASMAKNNFVAVVLAAGKGTRLKSNLAKVLHRAGGRTLVENVVRACKGIGARSICVVVGYQAEKVAAVVAPIGAKTAVQQPQRGTGHALLAAKRAIGGAKHVLVLPGDAPLVRAETLKALMRAHIESGAAATLLTAVLGDPTGYGRVVRRDEKRVGAIVEQSQLVGDQAEINEVNSSIYCFDLAKLWPAMGRLKPNNAHHELYLTDAVRLLADGGETVLAQIAPDASEILGCNTRAELAEADRTLRQRAADSLMAAGVAIQYPDTVVIDPDVTAGPDTELEAGVQLLGRTRIGANCHIGAGSILSDMTLGDGVTVRPYCVLRSSRVAARAEVGPFSHFRHDVELGEETRIGNFVEAKKVVLGRRVKANHLTYLGDARIGEGTNIGAGTITCNYDGVRKNSTTIGKRVFIGSDTALVAPVRVGDGAYVGAGSVITMNVPPDALAIARGIQKNIPGWARKRRQEMAQGGRAARKPVRKKTRPRPGKRARGKARRRR
ncbi:MAG TPA: bifunctional UDP-N-acetylglucosamine diphosphorylase/glucosamine-1-phosphate N-acetyltransferase GlmU [Candidatus Acidoferrum sp.]|nr:bifunctional UDP-N-acetylglucosamine diphosphorylase/glucosamine-1-phosphate N-acetyltransferase GlmU [Candidatus Acidoferrum sp.]